MCGYMFHWRDGRRGGLVEVFGWRVLEGGVGSVSEFKGGGCSLLVVFNMECLYLLRVCHVWINGKSYAKTKKKSYINVLRFYISL